MGEKSFTDIVILAGGIGERLWPASVPENPKQFLSVDGNLSFLQSSIQRALALEPEGKILVITRSSLVKGVAEQCVSLAEKSSQKDKDKIFNDLIIVAEPKPRHTCAPLVLACKMLKFFDKPTGQTTDGTTHTILTLASDHIISPIQSFLGDCAKASQAAQKGYFVCYAIPPSSPATGYGYIKAGSGLDGIENVFNIDNFKEKPDLETAKEYLKEGCYYWNSGMFAFTDDFFLNEVKKCDPSVWQAFENFAGGSLPAENKVLGIECIENWQLMRESYEKTPSIAVDNAVAERTDKAAAVMASFDWDDVGSWDSFEKYAGKNDDKKVISVEGTNNFVYSDLPVAFCGVSDLAVVVKNGKVLVMKKGSGDFMREVVKMAKSAFEG